MNYKQIILDFYRFEVSHSLFERKDKNGILYWDAIRYAVFNGLYRKSPLSNTPKSSLVQRVVRELSHAIRLLISFRKKHHYLFLTSSRNINVISGKHFDQNVQNCLELVGNEDYIILETYYLGKEIDYPFPKTFYKSRLIKKIASKGRYHDFSFIPALCKELKGYFGVNVDEDYLREAYLYFLSEKYFYEYLLKHWNINKIILTQNGVCKGLFAAAKERNISVIECQHGVIYDGHMLYSYPNIDFTSISLYLPNYLFLFSNRWMDQITLPKQVKRIPVGNDFFKPIESERLTRSNKFLVISSNIFVEALIRFVKECASDYRFEGCEFVFKLHPNQYQMRDELQQELSTLHGVEVVTNEKSVQQWMNECSLLIQIESTSAYEALQMERKVCILKRQSYQTMEPIFNMPNVYLLDNVDDLYEAICAPVSTTNIEYFALFNPNLAFEYLTK